MFFILIVLFLIPIMLQQHISMTIPQFDHLINPVGAKGYFNLFNGVHQQTAQKPVEFMQGVNIFKRRSRFQPFKWRQVSAQTVIIDMQQTMRSAVRISENHAPVPQTLNLLIYIKNWLYIGRFCVGRPQTRLPPFCFLQKMTRLVRMLKAEAWRVLLIVAYVIFSPVVNKKISGAATYDILQTLEAPAISSF